MTAPAAPLARYAPYRRAGDFIFLSGIIAVDPAQGKIVRGYDDIPPEAQRLIGRTGEFSIDVREGPIRAQSWYVLDRIRATLEAAGGGMEDVVRLVQYFRNLDDYPNIRASVTSSSHRPRQQARLSRFPACCRMNTSLLKLRRQPTFH